MSINVNGIINTVKDRATRQALKAIFTQLTADLTANKATFLSHKHPMILTYPALAAKATADPDIKTTADLVYIKSTGALGKIAAGNIDVSAVTGYTPTALATGKQRYFLLTVNLSTDAFGITEGADHATAAVVPSAPAGHLVVGWFKIVNTSGSNYTAGTTNMDAAGVADTYSDLGSQLNQQTAFVQNLGM